MIDIKFDHIIHYIDGISHFEFPGQYLQIQNGGRHDQLGTFNRLSYIDLSYIELLDLFDKDRLKQQSKSEVGQYSFASSIIESDGKQGFKKVCFRTTDMMALKKELNARGVETIGPIEMSRRNKKEQTTKWQLLYIKTDQNPILAPFFIQWEASDESRHTQLEKYFQNHLTMDMITFRTYQKQLMIKHWQKWFDMSILEETNAHTILYSPSMNMKFKIKEGQDDMIEKLTLVDGTISAPIMIRIKGASYQFIPPNHLEHSTKSRD